MVEQWSKIILYEIFKYIIDFERDKSEKIIARIEDVNYDIKIGKIESLMK